MKKSRLICIDFSEKISDIVFYYEHSTKKFGRCLIKKKKKKKHEVCEICNQKIESEYHYYPCLWDRVLSHAICADCYLESVNKWIQD